MDSAKYHYTNTILMEMEQLGEGHPIVSEAYQGLCKVHQSNGKLDSALIHINLGIKSLVTNKEISNKRKYNLKDFPTEPQVINLLNTKGKLLLQIAAKKNLNEKYEVLHLALETFQLASGCAKILRNSYQSTSGKLINEENADLMFDNAIECALTLYELTKENKYLEIAFGFSEQNKVGILKDALIDNHAKYKVEIPDSLLKREQKIHLERNYLQAQIHKQSWGKKYDTTELRAFQNKLYELEVETEKLTTNFEKNYPKYFQLKYEDKTIKSSHIQNKLTSKSALIEYFLTDKILHCFIITKTKFLVRKIPIDYRFHTCLNVVIKNLGIRRNAEEEYFNQKKFDDFVKNSKFLFDKLFGSSLTNELANIRNITIVPDGKLNFLPIEILLKDNEPISNDVNYRILPYLFKTHVMNYQFSGALFSESFQNKKDKKLKLFAGYAPVYRQKSQSGNLETKPLWT